MQLLLTLYGHFTFQAAAAAAVAAAAVKCWVQVVW
jgi:hypothetical protein